MSAHAYHYHCGCSACSDYDLAEEREAELAELNAYIDSLDPLELMSRNRRSRHPAYGRARTSALGKSYGYAVLDARAERIAAEVAHVAAVSRFNAAADGCLSTIAAVHVALRGAANNTTLSNSPRRANP